MGEHGLEGRGPVAREGKQQGGLEPAAVLVAALKIDVGLPGIGPGLAGVRQLRSLLEHGAGRGAGINPDVQRVGGLRSGVRADPISGFDERPEFGGGFLEPHVRAVLRDQAGRIAHNLAIEDGLARGGIKRGYRHAPSALPRDAPVRPRLHGTLDAVDAPFRNPFHPVDLSERLRPELIVVDLDEPLVHRAENDRGFAAPAMRVTVVEILLLQQRVQGAQQMQHGLVGGVIEVAEEQQHGVGPGTRELAQLLGG